VACDDSFSLNSAMAANAQLRTFRTRGTLHIMSVLLAIFAVASQVVNATSTITPDFSRSYVVWLATDEDQCTFFMTDAGLDADQLTDTLQRNYDAAAGIEILTDNDTPHRCIK
jgi:hypothetical protein